MRRSTRRFAAAVLSAALLLTAPVHAIAPPTGPVTLRVGLSYGSSTLSGANLDNNAGSGYRFGYFDEKLQFVQLGSTNLGQISMVKAQNVYFANGNYTDTAASSIAVGGYHLQAPGAYPDFQSVSSAAAQIQGGFPVWMDGTYYVRAGAYTTKEAAVAAQGLLPGATVEGASGYAVTVVQTGTNTVLFQFDGGGTYALGVKPGVDETVKAITWFKGYRYYGAFRYERLDGGNLTVANILPLEEYLKGVVGAEMAKDWPLEALKAQTVCARTYTLMHMNKHRQDGFDICNTTHCQAYSGLNQAGPATDRAVDETAGRYAVYQGELAETTYSSSNGGASEDAKNVWGNAVPYLVGVKDPWEETIASSIPNYRYTVTVTAAELTTKFRANGFPGCTDIVDFYVSERSATGNVIAFTGVDSAGKKYTISHRTKELCRNMLGLRSINYTITGGSGDQSNQGGDVPTIPGIPMDPGVPTTPGIPTNPGVPTNPSGSYFVNGTSSTIPSVSGAYAVDGNGNVSQIAGTPYVINGSGTTQALTEPSSNSGIPSGSGIPGAPQGIPVGSGGGLGGVYTISGSGYGHQVGMSQYGANAMAKQGKNYEEILKFYFTGITVQ